MTGIEEYMKSFIENVSVNGGFVGEFDILDYLDESACGETNLKGQHVLLYIDGDRRTDRNFILDPYMKIYFGPTRKKAKYMCRLSMTKPEYIISHTNTSPIDAKKEEDHLQSQQAKALANYLDKEVNGKTNWERCLDEVIKVSKPRVNLTDDTIENIKSMKRSEYEVMKYDL